MITELEQAIEHRLSTAFKPDGPIVASTVDDVSKYKNQGSRGSILVRYIGANYIPQGQGRLLRTWRFMILVGMKRFGQHDKTLGAYAAIDKTRNLLSGARIKIDEMKLPILLYPESEGFVMETAGVWWFHITFTGNDALIVI
jgi:hypothetical protein